MSIDDYVFPFFFFFLAWFRLFKLNVVTTHTDFCIAPFLLQLLPYSLLPIIQNFSELFLNFICLASISCYLPSYCFWSSYMSRLTYHTTFWDSINVSFPTWFLRFFIISFFAFSFVISLNNWIIFSMSFFQTLYSNSFSSDFLAARAPYS